MQHRLTPSNVTRSLPLKAGDVVAGKFRVEGLIGEGGMGIVLAATHLLLREPVALKFLRPEWLVYPEVVARFAFEARAAAKLKSEHVAHVLDVGDFDGMPFMVLEHLEGRNLGSRIAETGSFSLREASEIVIQICEALAEAHALGIVHRDVKPENLFLVDRGGYRLVKLIDFGISKAPEPVPSSVGGTSRSAATADEFAVLETGEIMGSPSYMSPEQLTQGRLDARTDLWSLGAVLYELLTGVPLFDTELPLPEIVAAVLQGTIPSVLDRRPDLPLAIAGVLSRCQARDPELRFQSAAELAVALLPFAPRRARSSAERAVSQVRSSGASEPRLPSSEAPRAPSREPRVPAHMSGEDPMWLAMGPSDNEAERRFALKPAPIPVLPGYAVSASAPTVRIDRVPAPLDSSPATSRSLEPTSPGSMPVRFPAVRASSPWALVAAVLALVAAETLRLGTSLPTPALGPDAPVDTGAAAVAVAVEMEAPSTFTFLEAFAEPSIEVLVLDLDASMHAQRERQHRPVQPPSTRAPCENPYGCDDPTNHPP